MNNLPSGLLAGGALQTISAPPQIRDAVLIGVDLGPNLSVTGSLATVLWLIALRREGEHISAWQFFKVGAGLPRRRHYSWRQSRQSLNRLCGADSPVGKPAFQPASERLESRSPTWPSAPQEAATVSPGICHQQP